MKDTKVLSWTGISSNILGLLFISFMFTGCDVLESDSDQPEPEVQVSGNKVYVLANGASYIDLTEKLQSTVSGRFAVTSEPKRGTLSDLGQGMLQYVPSTGSKSARDAFEFTFYSPTNEILTKDSVVIIIEDDSTNLPCNIYPVTDYAYGIRSGLERTVDVLSNDIVCGNDVVVTIYRPATSFPPYYGSARVVDNRILYLPGSSFSDTDKIMYKVTDAADSSRSGYGMVYFTGDSLCNVQIGDDVYMLDSLNSIETYFLPVFENDSLCSAINNYSITISDTPEFGSVTVLENGISYRVGALRPDSYADLFTYEVCIDAFCKSGQVKILLQSNPADTCQLAAVPDTLDLSGNTIPLMYLDVLFNDELCDEVTALSVVELPVNGTVFIDAENNTIGYNRILFKSDSLVYKVCNGTQCDQAKVYIKQ